MFESIIIVPSYLIGRKLRKRQTIKKHNVDEKERLWKLREEKRREDARKLGEERLKELREKAEFEQQQRLKELREKAEFEQRKKEEFEQQQKAKGLIKYIDRNGQERWGTSHEVKEWKAIELNLSNDFMDLSPKQFEEFVGKLFRAMGYETIDLPFVADYGADLIAKKNNDTIVIQVKKFARGNNVGAPEVQKTLGAMWKYKANKSVIVTTSAFTIAAEEQAKEAPIELWDIRQIKQITEKYLMGLTV